MFTQSDIFETIFHKKTLIKIFKIGVCTVCVQYVYSVIKVTVLCCPQCKTTDRPGLEMLQMMDQRSRLEIPEIYYIVLVSFIFTPRSHFLLSL